MESQVTLRLPELEQLLPTLKNTLKTEDYWEGTTHQGECTAEGVVRTTCAGRRAMVQERLPGICVLGSAGHQVCVRGTGVACVRKDTPNRLHGIQRQAVAWWLEERGKLEQPVCKIQGQNRAEVGSMPGQRVWRCEPGPDHSGSVFSMRRLDFSFYGKESH